MPDDLASRIQLTGQILVTEQTSEARLEVAALAGSKYVAFSVLGETCPLCLALDGKVFLADSDEARRFSPPLHINCDCIWTEVGELELGPTDLFTPDFLDSISDLVDQHGHFTTPDTKFDVLRVPAAPDGRDFTFRRAKDPETGQVRSELVWHRPRYELPGLRPETVQSGVAEVGQRAGVVNRVTDQLPTKSVRPGAPLPPGDRGAAALAEQTARELGVRDAQFGDHDAIAERLNFVVRDLTDAGYQAPPVLHISSAESEVLQQATRTRFILAFDADNSQRMLIDPRDEYWRNPAATAAKNHDERMWSTSDPNHAVLHDMAHWLHFNADPANYVSLKTLAFNADEVAVIARQVSTAADTPVEFMAEVFAQLWRRRIDGGTTSLPNNAIMDLYRKLGGIEP